MNWRIDNQGIVLAGRRLPVTRGQIMMLMVAVNLLFLGLDIYLAHGMNGTIRPYEWIPIIFGPAAGVVLLVAHLLVRSVVPRQWASADIIAFHLVRSLQPRTTVAPRSGSWPQGRAPPWRIAIVSTVHVYHSAHQHWPAATHLVGASDHTPDDATRIGM